MLREVIAGTSGLTTSVTAYTSGDQMGNLLFFPNAADQIGGSGYIVKADVLDESAVLGAFDLVLFNNPGIILAGDNQPVVTSAVDARNCQGVISFAAADLVNIGGRIVGSKLPTSGGHGFWLGGATSPAKDLYGLLIARTANNFFATANAIRMKLLIQDIV